LLLIRITQFLDEGAKDPELRYALARSITQIFISPIAGITLTLWSLK